MISAAHEDDRPIPTRPGAAPVLDAATIPVPRCAPEREGGPVGPGAARPTPPPLDAVRAAAERERHLDRVAVELADDARAALWALRLALLGVVGMVVLLFALL